VARARAASAAGGARREGRVTTSIATEGAGVVCTARHRRECPWIPSASVLEDHVLHVLESEHIAIVNVVDKLFVFVGLLVSGSFGEMEPHKGDKGVNVCQSFRVIQKLGACRRSRMVSTARTRRLLP